MSRGFYVQGYPGTNAVRPSFMELLSRSRKSKSVGQVWRFTTLVRVILVWIVRAAQVSIRLQVQCRRSTRFGAKVLPS